MANARRIQSLILSLASALSMSALAAAPAQAELRLCNRMSYVVEAAIATEDRGHANARGWFRIDPGQCRVAMSGALPSGDIYLHARTPALYGPSPLPQRGDLEFCVGADNFSISNARSCRAGQRLALFSAVRPAETEQGHVIALAEEADYSEDQTRDAGIQRLLAVAGYDPGPIDGVRGDKTDTAIRKFILDNKLTITAAARSDFFSVLMEAAQKPGTGFTWCNDTTYPVMAAIGIKDGGTIITRGWYRIEPGRCLRPEIAGTPRRVFSFAEAVDSDGQALGIPGRQWSWGGTTALCTRPTRFELSDHLDCAARGLVQTGFGAVEFDGTQAATVRFR